MKKLIVFAMLALFSITTVHVEEAEARRFGGGMSFGKQRTVKPQMQQRTAPTQQKNATAANTAKPKAGSGLMGMIGGLALGGLLGALFFGGAFEGINLFDILILGAIAFGLLWFFKRKAEGMAQSMPYQQAHQGAGAYGEPQPKSFEQAFGGSAASETTTETVEAGPVQQQAPSGGVEIDRDFFEGAAKDVFMRMQNAWNAKDIDEIRKFANEDAIRMVEAELAELGENFAKTDVGMLNAQVLDTWQEEGFDLVAVQFNAMLKEQLVSPSGDPLSEEQPREVAEIWIFEQKQGSEDPTWYLAGIQQVQ